MKRRILDILKQDRRVVSGETLSTELGISRVSVWKHIRKLQELGYGIESTTRGYRLLKSPDALYSWEFPGREDRMHYVAETDSTMVLAKEMARKGCPHMTVIVAGRQKKGRGRLRRTWLSAKGGLYFTLVLRPDIPTELAPRVNFFAGLILAQTLRNMYDIEAMVKWPNDILVEKRKLVGMLAEMEAEADMVTCMNIGIGINVNNRPRPREQEATSLKQLLHRNVSRSRLLAAFLDQFEKQFKPDVLETVIDGWKQYTLTIGRRVTVVTTRETTKGLAVDVDASGALLLKLADGSIKRIISGDCFL